MNFSSNIHQLDPNLITIYCLCWDNPSNFNKEDFRVIDISFTRDILTSIPHLTAVFNPLLDIIYDIINFDTLLNII